MFSGNAETQQKHCLFTGQMWSCKAFLHKVVLKLKLVKNKLVFGILSDLRLSQEKNK